MPTQASDGAFAEVKRGRRPMGRGAGLRAFLYAVIRSSIGRFVWYGMAIVWVFALVVIFVRRIPFGLVFGPLSLLYGASGLVFRDDDVDGPLPWSQWLAPVVAVGFLVLGTILSAASLALAV